MNIKIILILVFFNCIYLNIPSQCEEFILDFQIRILKNSQYILTDGEIYFDVNSSKLVTHFKNPQSIFVFTDKDGNYKYYEPESNSLLLKESTEYSSKNSFLYYFFNGKTQTLGIDANKSELKSSTIEDGMQINTWVPKIINSSGISKIEIVYENHLPIFKGEFNKGEITSKTFYDHFELICGYPIPHLITEILFNNDSDSIITEKKYFNIQYDSEKLSSLKNFKIPLNAKVN